MTVVVTAVFHPNPGRKDDLADALRAAMPAVHEERGCLLYALHDAQDGTLVMIEKWTSTDDLDAHANGAPVAALDAAIEPYLARPVVVTRMIALPAGSESGTH